MEENDELVRLVRELNASVGRPAQPAASEPATTPAPIPDAGETAPSTPPAGGAPASDPVSEMPPSPPVPAPSEADEASQGAVESLRPTAEKLDAILARAVRERASDVLLVAGFPPTVRVHGYLQAAGEDPLTPADTRLLALLLLDETRYKDFQREKAIDFSFERAGGRFRCDVHLQRGSVALALRAFPKRIPSLEELNLPPTLRRFTQLQRGLVLFVGPTGCGKSTSLAALIEIINRSRSCHIVTIEDPIEYRHRPGRSLVEQIEIGRDAVSFPRALRHCLRQDPDVILVGEMRDLETIAIALTAAETGHLVLSTLHTGDSTQTVDRIIDVFPGHQQNQVRQQLSLCLAGIVVQNLLPTADGRGRHPACEILLASDAIRNLIRSGKNHLIYSQVAMGKRDGMVTMEEALAELYKAGRITLEEAALHAGHPEEFRKLAG